MLQQNAGLAVSAVIIMTALNFLTHGTQDLYPSELLGVQHGLGTNGISQLQTDMIRWAISPARISGGCVSLACLV